MNEITGLPELLSQIPTISLTLLIIYMLVKQLLPAMRLSAEQAEAQTQAWKEILATQKDTQEKLVGRLQGDLDEEKVERQKETERLEAQVKELAGQLSERGQKIEILEREILDLRKQVESKDTLITELTTKLQEEADAREALQVAFSEVQRDRKAVAAERDALEKKVNALSERLAVLEKDASEEKK